MEACSNAHPLASIRRLQRLENPSMKCLFRPIACGLLGTCALLAGCGDESSEALIRSAKQYATKSDLQAAVIQLKSALQKAPNSPEARFLLGTVLLEAGDAVSADVELRKAMALKHRPADVVPALARAMLLEGQYSKLIREFASTRLADAASDADLLTSLAIAYAYLDKRREATTSLESALRVAPQDGRARVFQARLMADAGKVDDALAVVNDLLRATPGNYEALQFKGDLMYVVRHDPAAALDAHREALRIRPDLASSRVAVLTILLEQKDIAGARSELSEWHKIVPNHPEAKYFEAELALLDGNFKTARAIAQQLLQLAPNNLKVLLLAGRVEYLSGSTLQAENFLAKALQVAPSEIGIRRLLVHAFLRSGHSEKAIEVLAPVLDASDLDAETASLAAQAYLMNGDAKSAEMYFARATVLNPNDSGSRTALALSQIGKGNIEQGMSKLREIAASDKGNVADLALISKYLSQGNSDAALKAVDGLERKQSKGSPSVLAANLRGRIYLFRKDPAAARKSFERAVAIDPLYLPAIVGLAQLDVADKKPELAMKRFDAILTSDPKNVGALLALAAMRSEAGASQEEMLGLFSNVVKLNPAEVAPRTLLINAQIRHHDLNGAVVTAQEGLATQPESPELWDALGRVQLALGDTNAGVVSMKKVAELRPRSAEPHLRLAELYIASQDLEAARQSFTRALAIVPDLLAAQRGLVMVELSAGRPKQAMEMARRVQEVPANKAVGYLFAGDVERAQGHWADAATAYRAGLTFSDMSELAVRFYAALLSANSKVEAETFAADWMKKHPKDAIFLAYLGDLSIAKEDYVAALDAFTAVARLQPDNAAALNNLAWATSKLRRPGALAFAERANGMQPDQPAILDTWATILADENQIDKALDREKRAVELQPNYHPFRLNLAKLYIRAGKKSEAKRELDQLAAVVNPFSGKEEVQPLLKSL